MRKIQRAVVFMILFTILAGIGPAAAVDVEQAQREALDTDRLEDALSGEGKELLEGVTVQDSLSVDKGRNKLMNGLSGKIGDILKRGIRNAALVVMTAFLCSVVRLTFGDGGANYAVLAGVLAISALSLSSVSSFLSLCTDTLDEMQAFSRMLLPTLTAAAAASGAITSAAAKYAATVLLMDVFMTVAKNVVMPLIFAYTATSIAEAAVGGEALSGTSSLIKWLAKTMITVIVLAFIAYLSITGIISGATDAAAVRVTKVTLSTVLPVVGSIIADAADSVLAGASILRNAVGIFGLLAVIAICVIPFIRLGVNYLLYKAAGGLTATMADGRITKLVSAIGTAFGLLMGLLGTYAVMLYISVISVIRVVT